MNKFWKNFQDFSILIAGAFFIVAISYYLDPSNFALLGVQPHPFVIFGVLLSAYYGFRFSVLSSIVLSVIWFVIVDIQVDYDDVESLFDLSFLITPLTTIFMSILVGELKQKSLDKITDLDTSVLAKEKLLENFKGKIKNQENELEELKLRLVSKVETVSNLYDISLNMSELNRESLIKNFLKIIESQFDIKEASILQIGVETSELVQIGVIGNYDHQNEEISLEDIQDSTISNALNGEKLVTVKEVFNSNHFEEREKSALLACPIKKEGEIYGVLAIYDMPFLRYVPANFRLIEMLVRWLGKSLEQSYRFGTLSGSTMLDTTYQIWKFSYFKERLFEEFDQAKLYKLPLTLIRIDIRNFDKIEELKKIPIKKILAECVTKHTRKMDFAALGEDDNYFLILMLADDKFSSDYILKTKEEFQGYGLEDIEGEYIELSSNTILLNESHNNPEDLWAALG